MKPGSIVPLLFFTLYLLLGVLIYGDYGMSWDEELQRRHGLVSAKYIDQWWDYTEERLAWQELPTYEHRYYGVLFSLPAVWLEKYMELESFRQIFRMRHLLVFVLFWLSSILFYRILRKRFGHWGWALLGAGMLILCPRIFAHSFYNPKDLPFLSLYILGSWSLFRFWLKPGVGNALLHGLATGMLIAMRVTGVILPAVTLFLLVVDMVFNKGRQLRWYGKYTIGLLFYLPAAAGCTIALWPYLWEAPWQHFLDTFDAMAQYGWVGKALFRGQLLAGEELPWYYIFYWMAISIPFLYLLFAVAGMAALIPPSVARLVRRPYRGIWTDDNQRKDWGMLALLLAPLAAIIVKDAIVYDGWRHLFFVYPSLVYLAVYGCYWLWGRLAGRQPWRYALAGLMGLALANTAGFMLRHHPHQNVYFNILAPGDNLGKYDLDYWGLAYKQGFEALAEIDDSERVKVACNTYSGELNYKFLPPHLRFRFELVGREEVETADYFISDFRHWAPGFEQYRNREGLYAGEEVFAIMVGKTKVLGVYRVVER